MKIITVVLKWLLGVLGVVLVFVLVFFIPWGSWNLSSHPNPAGSYAEAASRIAAIQAAEGADFNPVCRAKFLTHGQKVERVIIMVHGYTNCPQQFAELGNKFFDLGYNVLIAPLPHHGLADRMNEAQAQLTAEELAAYADETVDIAQGLGQKVTMLGLSAGGVTTAWAAQNRSDIDLAVIVSPVFGFKAIPTPLTAVVMNLYRMLPDSFEWWDAQLQTATTPDYAYPRYSKHALVQTLRLGFSIRSSAGARRAAAKRIIVVSNANDSVVNNELTADFVKLWQAQGTDLSTYEFGLDLNLEHDLIDPNQKDQKIEVVYPRLIELVSR